MKSQWFELAVDVLGDREREFLAALCARAPQWTELGLKPEDSVADARFCDLSVALDICDRSAAPARRIVGVAADGGGVVSLGERSSGTVVRTLRVDFNGEFALCGEGEIYQILQPLDGGDSRVVISGNANPAQCAEFAARWVRAELARPIELREWHTPQFRHKRYILTDEERCVRWSDSRNTKRHDLGAPDAVRLVHPPG